MNILQKLISIIFSVERIQAVSLLKKTLISIDEKPINTNLVKEDLKLAICLLENGESQ